MATYLLSNGVHQDVNKYKFGKTILTRNQLETTYQRYLDGAQIIYWFPVNNHTKVETDILNILDEFKSIADKYFEENKEALVDVSKPAWLNKFGADVTDEDIATIYSLFERIYPNKLQAADNEKSEVGRI